MDADCKSRGSKPVRKTIMQAYAEIFHYQNTSANIALFDAVGGEEEAFVHSVRPFPFHLIPAYQPVMPWPVTKQKIDKDFILVCEFSEIIGPTSLITIPRDGGRNFDKDMFAVRIMAVDYNATNTMRCYASFTIVEDTSVIIEDKEENVYAYVHHFTLYDIHARGYVRPFCMAYVTPDKNKLFTFLEKLMAKFKSVSQLFRSGNQLLFKTELDQRLADLLYTKDSMQFPVATSLKMAKSSTANSKDNTDVTSGQGEETIPCQRRRTIVENSQEALTKAIQDCQGMLHELRQKMESSSFLSKYKKEGGSQNRSGCDECCLGSLGYHSDSETVISTGSKTNICNSTLSKSLSSLCKVTNCHCNSQPYQPRSLKSMLVEIRSKSQDLAETQWKVGE
ncbi:putative smith-Magenis syndrome chromosomal region candidate protein 8-B protein-like [Apostichopus japonicus]|uniref:Putative smith-Magenis syndrome chromosomal region candidate protein 8-B protein-like n=1 Tax=Stichopus japonicus TaxID=307972 RepID=A0A2G8K2M8_STIJA|nr:putative smith-Magenis syndrome chromosomal region candidate protein 8-B protein-like [Apostichopus japonicus]